MEQPKTTPIRLNEYDVQVEIRIVFVTLLKYGTVSKLVASKKLLKQMLLHNLPYEHCMQLKRNAQHTTRFKNARRLTPSLKAWEALPNHCLPARPRCEPDLRPFG